MSGFEIAGLVLGAIPVLLEVLKLGNEAVRTYKGLFGYKAVANRYLTDFEAEAAIFKNTLIFLLEDVAPPAKIDMLLGSPQGEAWRDNDFLRRLKDRRLGDNYNVVLNVIRAMDHTLDEFIDQLGARDVVQVLQSPITPQVNANNLQGKKVFAKLCKNRDVLDKLMLDLAAHNRRLEQLTRMSPQVRAKAKAGKLFTRLEVFRKQVLVLYNAVQSSLTCRCYGHEAGIVLGHQDDAFSSPFTILFGTCGDQSNRKTQWQAINAEILVKPDPPPSSPQATGTAIRPKGIKVSFADLKQNIRTPMATTAVKTSHTAVAPAPAPPAALPIPTLIAPVTPITNFCEHLCQTAAAAAAATPANVSAVNDQNMSFNIALLHPPPDLTKSPISMQKWLLAPRSLRLSFPEKMLLAVSIASAVTGLSQTSWVPSRPNKEHMFVWKMTSEEPARLCIVTPLRPKWTTPSIEVVPRYVSNPALFILGIVLIELIFGEPLDQLHALAGYQPNSQCSKWEQLFDVADALLEKGHVRNEGGLNYDVAVRFCIKGDPTQPGSKHDLNEKATRQAIYQSVIAPLDETIANLKLKLTS